MKINKYIITIGIILLSLKIFSQKKLEKNKQTIVFFHPYLSNENYFKEFSKPLKDKYNIIYLKGFKGSKNALKWYDLDIYNKSFINVSQAKETIRKIDLKLKNINNIILIGYSQGGVIANGLMLFKPKKYKKVISINSYITEELIFKKNNNFSKAKVIFIYGKNDFLISKEMIKNSFSLFKKYKINSVKIKHYNYHSIDLKLRNNIIKTINDGRI
ncbi:alpha/beta hydrolase [Tenacibaculum finnmarkense]|uniref:alpha/beta hydrolase n=1 Tax=Tenacibaculum finnmarkense TaxID=2781243 RepID=UPI001EFB2C45|nr:serine hydrolase family protein [Tenacibaculum finnmarkense]MCG8226366.1 hypothetical protein [Tenacibaculum finnmarkense genomovar finnmarkense]